MRAKLSAAAAAAVQHHIYTRITLAVSARERALNLLREREEVGLMI